MMEVLPIIVWHDTGIVDAGVVTFLISAANIVGSDQTSILLAFSSFWTLTCEGTKFWDVLKAIMSDDKRL